MKNDYNNRGGVNDEEGNLSEYGSRNAQSIREDITTNDRNTTINNSKEQSVSKQDGNMVQSNSGTDTGRNITNIDSSSKQLKLDFSQVTPENIGASIAKGDIDLTDVNNIDNIVNHIMNNDVEICRNAKSYGSS